MIRSGLDGIYSRADGGAVTIVNAGSITGGAAKAGQAGLLLLGPATVTNQAKGLISGRAGIFAGNGAATVTNDGTITGVTGIAFAAADSGNHTVVNTGTIIGTGGTAVVFGGAGSNLLVMNSGSSLKGAVIGSTIGANTVQLAGSVSGPVVATLSSQGLVNFQTVAFAPVVGNRATLAIATLAGVPKLVVGFTDPLETIDLIGLSDSAKNAVASFDPISDILTVTAGTKSASLQLDNESYAGVHFVADQDSVSGTKVQPLRSPSVTSVTTLPATGKLGAGKVVTFTVNFSTTVTVLGGVPTLLLNDGGTAKYTGGSGKSALTFAYTVATGDSTPDLAVTGTALNGATIMHGIGNLADLTGAAANPAGVLQIDAVRPPTNTFLLVDTDTKTSTPAAVGNSYTGSALGVLHEYNSTTSDSVSITTTTPGWSILTGAGNDAINVTKGGGNNILDGGGGSNFLVGGSGNDMFFLDDRNATVATWNTIVGFHAGDSATIWGLSASDFSITHTDNQGAAGYKGLTYAFSANGKPQANITIAGYTYAKVQGNHLTVSYGTGGPTSNAPGSPFMMLQAS